jgi:uncharacterized protein (TIGR02466 family)
MTTIWLEKNKRLTVLQELGMIEAAHARSPGADSAVKLGLLYILDDRFAEAVALLNGSVPLNYQGEMLLAQAYVSLETPADDVAAYAAADRAVALAVGPAERAAALAFRAKAEKRLGNIAAAHDSLTQALAADPQNKDACKRLSALALDAGDPDQVLALTDKLAAVGVAHARVFSGRYLALAQRGDIAAARAAQGFADLHQEDRMPTPPGWSSLADFNDALASELLAHPGMRYERYGSASAATWRVENPLRHDMPHFRTLSDQIMQALISRIAALKGNSHPWARVRPSSATLRMWCVITEEDGFESWHVHQFGWLSGVYYVRVPDSVANGNGRGGCLAFGLPADVAGPEASAAFGEILIRPQPGMVLSFPSHIYHRTYPHGTNDQRICVAFDLQPAAEPDAG